MTKYTRKESKYYSSFDLLCDEFKNPLCLCGSLYVGFGCQPMHKPLDITHLKSHVHDLVARPSATITSFDQDDGNTSRQIQVHSVS
ncbi:hypothetical protein K402DRAFT_394596 [Aulographum hederae CBS 113979]|uniref:Uncharacterized protein n=1 Tax=Aulographum hederae CBS 113979 TaxID=1176131 RepID=A0A6G1GXF3_9PEZI|nr:hypothetical protein K402DRAFT_394596 [Aulographum hederae CBS 113979]